MFKQAILISVVLAIAPVCLQAAEMVRLKHELISAETHNGYSVITLSIVIDNNDLQRLSSVKLLPRNIDLNGNPEQFAINVGNLPVSGQYSTIWQFPTSMNTEIFASNSLLVFELNANTQQGESVNFPVYSE